MSYKATVYNIMIASPSDVNDERQIAQEVILEWNNINSFKRKVVLMPLRWEINTYSAIGRPQDIINEQMLKKADILIGIFWTRIGTNTGKAVSGTVEEIEEHIKLGKDTMLFFSNKNIEPSKIDLNQYDAVKKLKNDYQTRALINSFNTKEDFKDDFTRQLTLLLNEEKYNLTESEDENDIDNNLSFVKNLSDNAKTMLIKCSEDSSGKILKISSLGGSSYIVNSKVLNENEEPRTLAKWESALEELLELGLVKQTDSKGKIFNITDKGYNLADTLKDVK
jgi:hypothetical protein